MALKTRTVSYTITVHIAWRERPGKRKMVSYESNVSDIAGLNISTFAHFNCVKRCFHPNDLFYPGYCLPTMFTVLNHWKPSTFLFRHIYLSNGNVFNEPIYHSESFCKRHRIAKFAPKEKMCRDAHYWRSITLNFLLATCAKIFYFTFNPLPFMGMWEHLFTYRSEACGSML